MQLEKPKTMYSEILKYRLIIGSQISAKMAKDARMSLEEADKLMKISKERASRLERMAFFKLSELLREFADRYFLG